MIEWTELHNNQGNALQEAQNKVMWMPEHPWEPAVSRL
jgi:hypothetical protein